jgi:hypothetical protein
MNLTGSLTVVTTGTELQVTSTGVRIGNVITDTHPITGSVNVSGSLSGSSANFSGFLGINGSPGTAFPLEAYINSSTAYSSTSRGNVMRVYNSNTSSNVFAGIELGGAGPSNDGLAGLNAVVTSAGSAALTFYTRNSNTFSEKFRISSEGNFDYGGFNIQSSNNTTYRQAFYGGLSIMWRGFTDWYLNSNHTYSSSNTNVASYTTSNGLGRLSVTGGDLDWATYDGSVTAGSSYALATKFLITKAGAIQVGNVGRNALQQSNFGYNGAYKTLIVGSTGTNYLSDAITVCFGVDVIGNTGGSFSGDGSECIFRNAGAFRSPNSGNTNYNTLISWNSSGVVTVTTSDYRAKEDLKSFEALPMIEAMKLYDFRWIELQERMHGVLAHELQEIVPYAVIGEKDGDSRQGVDYSKLVPVMLKAIQELNTKFEEYKATHP